VKKLEPATSSSALVTVENRIYGQRLARTSMVRLAERIVAQLAKQPGASPSTGNEILGETFSVSRNNIYLSSFY
jgi:hypothetical protein